jgi:two-component system, NarL family, response regulator YdfI
VNARARGDLIARIPVIAYCPNAARLSELGELVGATADLELQDAASSLARLAESALRSRRAVVVARLDEGVRQLPELTAHSNGLPIVALLPNAGDDGLHALRAGARAVLGNGASGARLAAAVSGAFHGLAVLPAGTLGSHDPLSTLEMPEPLTPRELEILGLLAAGDSNKTIATRLSISVHTVKFHISSILTKLGVSSRTEAVTLGLKLGIVLL